MLMKKVLETIMFEHELCELTELSYHYRISVSVFVFVH